jgi:DNA replication protein DnaC
MTPARNCCSVRSRPWLTRKLKITFDQWGRFLPEHTTAVSLLDRLLHHANVVVTDGDSYRMRQARAKGGTTPKKN